MNIIEKSPSTEPKPDRQFASIISARAACIRIAPLWPLQNFVAVNPFVGLTAKPFTEVCELMNRMVPGGMQMPASYYRDKFASGAITDADLDAALAQGAKNLPAEKVSQLGAWSVERLKKDLGSVGDGCSGNAVRTVADSVDQQNGTEWASAITEAVGQFCGAYYDQGQSAWRLPWKALPLFSAWRESASLDASFELLGLPKFRSTVTALPDDPEAAITQMLESFHLDDADVEDFLHKQLLTIRGWAGYVQYLARENGIHGRADDSLLHLLAIRLAYDAALLAKFDSPAFREFWPAQSGSDHGPSHTLAGFIWQLADEHAWQRQLFGKLCAARDTAARVRPAVQAVFCIDVRSEILRRALEATSPTIETLGFAGFFGLPIEYIPFGKQHGPAQCPVLLTPKFRVREKLRAATELEEQAALRRQRLGKRITHSWNAFQTSAISCFSFVETAGLGFGAKLFRDAFTPAAPVPAHPSNCEPHLATDESADCGIALEDRVALALGALRNMGLKENFARLVLLCGHGSATTNNPYGSALDCGACGGHAGDSNARVGAAILNDSAVRSALAGQIIAIPDDTRFLAGLHNTTTDEVTLFDLDLIPASHASDLADLQTRLASAGKQARKERSTLLGLNSADAALDQQISARSCDWAQVRPEWGLAGNAAFIAAPRARTQHADLGGRVFLHNYDHRDDTDNSTLELIMIAPMVVANWINLQYYASTVNNAVFGSGNKAIHNVVGTLGVCLGNGGDLQTGLPLQSVHDGTRWIHEPLRLHVLLEAPRERIEAALAKHASVRQLVENGWLLLFAIEDEGTAQFRYVPGGRWEASAS